MRPLMVLLLSLLLTACVKEKLLIPDDKVIDIDRNVYNVISIGMQSWTKENLRVTKYNDGAAIEYVTYRNRWNILSTPAYCWYDNDELSYRNTYGALYNWYAVETDKLCPTGWHVPSNDEWQVMINYLGGDDIAGGKLKESGTIHWLEPNMGATNKSGFTALPGGFRDYNSDYLNLTLVGFWWTSTEHVEQYQYGVRTDNAFNKLLHKHSESIFGIEHIDYPYSKNAGMSVRCIKNN